MALRSRHGFDDDTLLADLTAWFRAEPGAIVCAIEQRLLGRVLPDLFGYHIVQLGSHHGTGLCGTSRISHQVRVDLGHEANPAVHLHCAEDALPFAPNAIDVLVLPHVLEFADDPRRVLREAERVLIGEGHIVIVGFNPWSLYGAWSLACRWGGRPPWVGRFIGVARVKDWLQLLGFDIQHVLRGAFRPPCRHPGLNRRLAFVERLGAFAWPWFANVYVLVARKRVEGVTPLKASWRQRRRVIAAGVVEPTARSALDGAGPPRGE